VEHLGPVVAREKPVQLDCPVLREVLAKAEPAGRWEHREHLVQPEALEQMVSSAALARSAPLGHLATKVRLVQSDPQVPLVKWVCRGSAERQERAVRAEPAGPKEFLARLEPLVVSAHREVTALLVVQVRLVALEARVSWVAVERTERPARKDSTARREKRGQREQLVPAVLRAAQEPTAVLAPREQRVRRAGRQAADWSGVQRQSAEQRGMQCERLRQHVAVLSSIGSRVGRVAV
jgi:hypothetical protein